MNFGEALVLLQEGHTLRRAAWKITDPQVRVTLEEQLGVRTQFKKVVACRVAHYTHCKHGWNPHPNEILATDWELV
jgi:hypothetical protein